MKKVNELTLRKTANGICELLIDGEVIAMYKNVTITATPYKPRRSKIVKYSASGLKRSYKNDKAFKSLTKALPIKWGE